MSRPKEARKDEFYRAKIRELEKEIRSLRRLVKDLEKAQHWYEDVVVEEVLEERAPKKEKNITCQSCGKNDLKLLEVFGKIYGTCGICGPQGRIK